MFEGVPMGTPSFYIHYPFWDPEKTNEVVICSETFVFRQNLCTFVADYHHSISY